MPDKKKENATEKATINIPDGMGLREWSWKIEDSWEQKTESDLRYSYVREVYPDYIIVASGYGVSAKTHKVTYTVSDDEVTFDTDNMTKVELKTEWVTKSFKFSNPTAIKSIGENRIGAYGIIWGDPDTKDAHEEYFDSETEDLLNVFKTMGAVPWLFHHGGEEKIKSTVIGKIDVMEPDDVGLWYEAKIIEQEMYKDYVEQFVKDGRLYSSSGTLPAAKSVTGDGYIKSWPVAEISGTWVPAEYRMILQEHSIDEVKGFYKSIGIDNLDKISEDFADNSEDVETDTPESDVEDTDDGVDVDAAKLELAKLELDFEKLEIELETL